MDPSPSVLIRLLVPRIPFILKTTLLHSLWLSSTSSKWDLRTELTIKILRQILNHSPPSSVSKQQHQTIKDPGVKGRMWISRAKFPTPQEGDVRQLLCDAIEQLKEGDEKYAPPTLAPLEGEWTGYRANVAKDAPEPNISEAEKYDNLMKEVTSDVTVLYFHGGAYYLLDPASHRVSNAKYAKLTGGRVFSVRYRLAPQNPFPAQLLDAFVAYLSLLYPPPGALHEPVPSSHVVFAGDSAGGHLAFSLLQLLLQLHRTALEGEKPTVTFHGKGVEIPLPAGVTGHASWLDITRCMPSMEDNAHYDYLPPPSQSSSSQFPPCSAWPTEPPRHNLFCEGSALCHPLVSPLAALNWEGAPPVLITCGEEMLADENKVVAQRLAIQGVKVVWEQYEAMPHCFALMLEGLEAADMCFSTWVDFTRRAVINPESIHTEGHFIAAKSLVAEPVNVKTLTEWTDGRVVERMRETMRGTLSREEAEVKEVPRL